MRHRFFSICVLIVFLLSILPFNSSCVRNELKSDSLSQTANQSITSYDSIAHNHINNNTVKTRYHVPEGFHRAQTTPGSFAEYLQNLPLKPTDYTTHLYDGTEKKRKVATSVIDMDIDPVDLQQCADAIIRLRAEYLYHSKQFDKIHFNFTNGFQCDYTKWAQGYRIKANGNHTSWYKETDYDDYSYPTFRKYLLKVFEYAGTASLANELHEIQREEIDVGTIIIEPGFPGHAVIVVDMILPDDSLTQYKGKGVLLAQSYMPAQEIEILEGYQDELGMFSKTSDPDYFRRLWSPTRHKAKDDRFYTAEYSFVKPKFMIF